MDSEGKDKQPQSAPPTDQPEQQSAAEKNPFMRTVADLIHRGRNRRTMARPR